MRLFTRALRRAALPLAMSRGYNPRPRISIPAPLGVGIEGENEVLDLELCRWCRPEVIRRTVNKELPKGIRVIAAEVLRGKPERRPAGLSYRVPLIGDHSASAEALEELMAAENMEILRKSEKGGKIKDIAPFISHLRLHADTLSMLLVVTNHGTARPEEVLDALSCKPYSHYLPSQIARTHVSLIASQ